NWVAPGYAVVSTWVESDGSRRHSSYRYDWMPPTLGGKSLVTRSDVTGSRDLVGEASLRRHPRHHPAPEQQHGQHRTHGAGRERAAVARERGHPTHHERPEALRQVEAAADRADRGAPFGVVGA